MVFFGVKVEENKESLTFFKDSIKRSKEEDFFKNPYEGGIKRFSKGFYIVNLKPVYPKIYIGGFYLLAISFMLTQKILSYYHLFGVGVLSTYFLFSNTFFKTMVRMGLRKAGYKEKVSFISLLKVAEAFYNGRNRSLRDIKGVQT